MLSNECQCFLICIAKIQSKFLKTVQNKKDAVKEDVIRVIHEFSDLPPMSKWLTTVQSKEDVVKEGVARVIYEFKESIRNK